MRKNKGFFIGMLVIFVMVSFAVIRSKLAEYDLDMPKEQICQ